MPGSARSSRGKSATGPVPQIVEFTGLPGAGKTFLATRLRAALVADGVVATDGLGDVAAGQPPVRRITGKLRLAVGAAVTEPVATIRTVGAVTRSGQPPSQLLRRSQNALVVGRSMARARRRPGIHVFDQGLVQELHSIAYAGRWEQAVHSFGPRPGRAGPDLIVSVRASPELASARLAARADAGSRLDTMPAGRRLAWLATRATELVEVEERWLAVHGRVVPTRRFIVEVDDDDPASLERILSSLIEAVRSAD